MSKLSTTKPPILTKMAGDQTLRGKYAESAMKGLLSSTQMIDTISYSELDWLIETSFLISDRMIETEFKK